MNNDRDIEKIWEQFEDVTLDNNDCITSDFHIWKAGTSKEEIWGWFNKNHSQGIYYLMNDYEIKY